MVMDRGELGNPPKCIGFEQLTIDNTAAGIGFTAATYKGARYAECQVSTAEIRYRRDGTAPTTTVGTLGEVYDIFYVGSPDLANFKAIRTGTTSGVLNCHYYK